MLGGNVFFSLAVFLGLFILGLTGGRWVSQRFMDWLRRTMPWPSSFIGVAMVLVLLVSAVFEAIGIHAIFGAFLVGVMFARNTQVRDQAHEVFYQFTISKFAPLYFVSLGLRANFIANLNIGLTTLILLIACVGKIGGASIGAWASGLRFREALAIGFGMNSRGAMELILASVALQYGMIRADVYVALVIMAFFTSMLSGPMMQKILRIKIID
jgi:Kef-type K+ transport system membrane component KefB